MLNFCVSNSHLFQKSRSCFLFTAFVTIFIFFIICNSYANEQLINDTNGNNVKQISASASHVINTTSAKHVIETQLKAFQNKSPSELWDTMSDAMRGDYENADMFWIDTRKKFKPLRTHISHSFIGADLRENTQIHKIMLFDDRGQSFLSIFKLSANDNAEWKIDNVTVIDIGDSPI